MIRPVRENQTGWDVELHRLSGKITINETGCELYSRPWASRGAHSTRAWRRYVVSTKGVHIYRLGALTLHYPWLTNSGGLDQPNMSDCDRI